MGIDNLKSALVTGGAGFIGSNLVEALLNKGYRVTVLDDLRTGDIRNLNLARINFLNVDLLDPGLDLVEVTRGIDEVYHFAANADVKDGWKHPQLDLEQNTLATVKLIEACSHSAIKEFIFSSTGSVYGEPSIIPTPEEGTFPRQTSLYGASKISAEAFIEAYCEAGRLKATIFRFVSVLGKNYSHGHVIDFVRKLRADPTRLKVLGDGSQKKSYMNVQDCIRGVLTLRTNNPIEIFNLGVDGYCDIRQSISWITKALAVNPTIEYLGGERGWVGDNPFIWLDVSKAASLGWKTECGIEESIIETVRWVSNRLDCAEN